MYFFPLVKSFCPSFREDMLSALPLLQNIMQDWGQQTDDFQAWESKLKNLEDMHSVLNEALMNNQHALYTLSDRSVFLKTLEYLFCACIEYKMF